MTKPICAALLLLTFWAEGCAKTPNATNNTTSQDSVKILSIPTPPKDHPRLYIRPDGISALRARMETTQGKEIIAKLNKLSVPRTAEEEAKATDRGFRYYFQMRGLTSKVQLEALDYLTNGNKEAARAAITSMLDSLKKTSFGTNDDLSRASGAMLMVGAIVYDWCYDQMTSAQRQAYIKEFVRIAGTMECKYPPKNTEPIAGHSSEWMVLRDMLSAGIAIYDEYPDMYNYVVNMLYKDYIPARNYIYAGGNYHQGVDYVDVRFTNDLISQWIMTKMGAGPLYSFDQKNVMYDFIYRRRPDNQVMPAGDCNPRKRSSWHSYALPAMLASSYYKDPYIAMDYEKNPTGVENHCLILELLWRDFSLTAKSPDDLPLTRWSGTPFGWMIARTGWGANSVIAEMKVNEHFVGNHQHLDGGSFQIYYKGPLAIDSGAYQGASGGYNSPHNKNYFKRTIAHNSLLVYDPSEQFGSWNYGGDDKTQYAANDGGQRMPGIGWDTCRSFKDLLGDSYTVGQTLAHSFGPDKQSPDYTYLKGDITKAYSAKVKDVRRSFVFLNLHSDSVPGALIIFDHIISSNPSFKKYWLLHSIEQPQVSGSSFTVTRTLNGDSGMLKCDMLYPSADNSNVEVIGGEGKDCWVFGTNYPNAALPNRPDEANERGAWRVQISPKADKAEDIFLNVIQVTDAGNKTFNVNEVTGQYITGAVLSNRAVTFSRSGKPLENSFSFTIPDNGSSQIKILVTDLAAGNWTVKKDGKKITSASVSQDDGSMYFEATSGEFTISK